MCVWWLEPAIQSTSSPWSAVNFKKTADLGKVYVEPAIWSRDTGQRIPCFDRCQLTITLMSNIKDVCCKLFSVKWSIASLMSSKLEPVIWLRVLVTLAYMKGRTDVRTYVRCTYGSSWRHGYKTKFSHIDRLPYFLKYGAPRARAFGARGAPLLVRGGF